MLFTHKPKTGGQDSQNKFRCKIAGPSPYFFGPPNFDTPVTLRNNSKRPSNLSNKFLSELLDMSLDDFPNLLDNTFPEL